MRWAAADLRGARLWWIAELRLGGALRRYATQALSITSTTEPGGAVAVSAALDVPALRKSTPAQGATPEARTARITVLPDETPGLWSGRGLQLEGQPVTLSLWREGDIWEDRRAQLRGTVVGVAWGAEGEPLELEIEESIGLDRAVIPAPGAVVTATTWPDAAPAALGEPYPMIIGQPGRGGVQASAAVWAESVLQGGARDLLLVAGHPVAATAVTIYDDAGAYESLAVEHVTDGAGQRVAVVDLAAATTIAIDPEGSYRAAWTSGPGLIGVSGTGATSAGEVIAALLALSSLAIDTGSVTSARDALAGYLIDAVIDDAISPSAWVASALLPLLPIALVAGVDGWGVRVIPVRPRLSDAIATLRVGPMITRDGAVQGEGYGEIANRIALRYARGGTADETTAEAVIAATPDDGAHASADAARSVARYGVRELTQQTDVVYDASTAYLIARGWAQQRAAPRWRYRYQLGIEWAWLEPGDVLRLIDADIDTDAAVVLDVVEFSDDGLMVVEMVEWRA
jgi:hypothetical protein